MRSKRGNRRNYTHLFDMLILHWGKNQTKTNEFNQNRNGKPGDCFFWENVETFISARELDKNCDERKAKWVMATKNEHQLFCVPLLTCLLYSYFSNGNKFAQNYGFEPIFRAFELYEIETNAKLNVQCLLLYFFFNCKSYFNSNTKRCHENLTQPSTTSKWKLVKWRMFAWNLER